MQRLESFLQGLRAFWDTLSKKLRLYEALSFFSFLLHRYRPQQFSPRFVRGNIKIISRVQPKQWLTARRQGELRIIDSEWQKGLFRVRNALLLGAVQKRVEKVVFFTLVALTIEIDNPFEKRVLRAFLNKKFHLIESLLSHVKTINGKKWDQEEVTLHLQVFLRNSLLQERMIRKMREVVHKEKKRPLVEEAKRALNRGLYPVLVTVGVSGSYWMRGEDRRILGLFKPFDEELFAPHNPMGPKYRGILGMRKIRMGCRVGESPLHEVAAFVVDAFLGFGIVPRTYFATFSHHIFFSAREDRLAFGKAAKHKYGSFQEFVGGFKAINYLTREEIEKIPLEEFQLLFVLDVIIGNTDRNTGNILVGDGKLAAIDHGLSFPDCIDRYSFWYWSFFPQGKHPLFQTLVDLLNAFPINALFHHLRRCHISVPALEGMRERVALLAAAVNGKLVPSQMEELFTYEYLKPLQGLDKTLSSQAALQVEIYKEAHF